MNSLCICRHLFSPHAQPKFSIRRWILAVLDWKFKEVHPELAKLLEAKKGQSSFQ